MQTYKINTPDGYFETWAVQPDKWPGGGYIIHKDQQDKVWTGRDDIFRIETEKTLIPTLPIAIKPVLKNGHAQWKYNHFGHKELKIKIEFIKDGEDSTWTNGIAYCE